MAGQIIISNIKTDSDNAFSILANTGAVLFSANLASGITTGIADGSVTNAKLAGSITGNKIATGQITGNLIATNAISQNNIVSVNASVASVGTLPTARLPAGSVLQVVSNTKTDTFSSSSSGSWIDITGLSATITPTSASNKILVSYSVVGTNDNGWFQMLRIVRGATPVGVGDTSGSRTSVTTYGGQLGVGAIDYAVVQSSQFLDSPATTSATTYKLQMYFGGNTSYVNRSPTDSDTATYARAVSTITVMEIAA